METCIVKEVVTESVKNFARIYGCPNCNCAFEKCAALNKREARVAGSCNYVDIAECPKCKKTGILKY